MARIALNCSCGWNFFIPGSTAGHEVTCPSCGQRYDLRLAGRASDGSSLHLDPLPLLADATGVRIALPEGAA